MVLSYVKENLKADLSVESLVEVASLSSCQFSRMFTEEAGMPPAMVVEQLRVESARLMMETGHHQIEIITRNRLW